MDSASFQSPHIVVSKWCYCEPIEQPELMARSSRDLALKLIRWILAEDSTGNFMVSPWSITNGLEMVRIGTTGNSEFELRNFLHSEVDAKESADQLVQIRSGLSLLLHYKVIQSVNGIWINKERQVNETYLAQIPALFDADVRQSAMPEPALSEINDFVRERTSDQIPKIFDSLEDFTDLVLLNVATFRDTWKSGFNPEVTQEEPFYVSEERPVTAKMMRTKSDFEYHETATYQRVRLGYESELSMTIILPKNQSLDAVLDELGALLDFRPGQERKGTVKLPQWKSDYSVDLGKVMRECGCESTFESTTSDLDAIFPQAHLGQVIHKTYISVNEKGTEAAAALGSNVKRGCDSWHREGPFTFVADHPFAYFIHTPEGVVLYAGVVNNPSAA